MDQVELLGEIRRLRRRVGQLEGVQAQLAKTERALQESEERFRSLFEESPVAYQSLDESGRYVDCNGQLCKLLGYSRDELLGKRFDEYWHADSKHLFSTMFGEFKDSRSVRTELRLVRKDGSTATVLSVGIIQYDAEGRFVRTHCILHDITKRQQTEDQLRKTEQRYRSLFEDAPLMYVITRSVDGVPYIRHCNESFLRCVGRSREEVIDQPLEDFYSANSAKLAIEDRDYARALGGQYFMGERDLVTSSGKVISALLYSTPEEDESGRAVGTRAMYVDITERKSAEAKLREAYDIINRSPSVAFLWKTDEGWPVEFVTDNVEDLWGYTSEDFTSGKVHYLQTVHPDDLQTVIDEVSSYTSEEGEEALDHTPYRIVTKDGKTKWVEDKTVKRRDEKNRITHFQGILSDITCRMKAEEEVRAKNHFLSSLLESAPHPFYVVDAHDYTVVMANTAARENLASGLSTCYEMWHASGHRCITGEHSCPLDEIRRTLQPVTVEHVHINKEGDPRHAEVFAYPIFAEDGSLTHMVEYAVDVTERKIQEDLLKQRSQALTARVKEMKCLHHISRLLEKPSGSLDECLSEILEVLPQGFQFPEATAARIVLDDLELKSSDYRSASPALSRQIVVRGEQRGSVEVCITEDHPSVRDETFLDEENDLLDSIAATLGIAVERSESAKQLSTQVHFMGSLLDSIPEPVFYKDVNKIFVGCNRAFSEFHGKSSDEIIGKTTYEIYAEELAEIFTMHEDDVLRNPTARMYETSVRRSDGSLRDVIIHKAPFRDYDGNLAGIIGVFVDVTDQKCIEAQLRKAQRLESIATLASGIAHDFNNLLTIISGYAELGLADNREGDPGHEELKVVLDAAGRGGDLVRQILTFSREVETKPKATNLNDQVRNVQKLLYKTIPKMIEIRTHLDDDLPIVMADPTQIEQVLLNLAVNSRDAMPDGGLLTFQTRHALLDQNYCRLHPDVQPGEYAELTIADTGRGMEREVLDRVFEPFFSTKEPGEGTGLGLAMAFGIVRSHQGHITCYSEPGRGTQFNIYFPAITEEETSRGIPSSGEFTAFGSETILLVDDEELILELGNRILTQSGYRVLTAADGMEALKVFQAEREDISLIILDVIMPVMGGKECFNELLKIDPDVKVLISSGFATQAGSVETFQTKSKGFVSKPFQMDRLLQAIRRALDE